MDMSSPLSDSGYETEAQPPHDAPGVLETKGKFAVQAKVLFVTYSRSQVDDVEVFERSLRDSLSLSLPKKGRGDAPGTVQVFGSKELHEDGTPHYHVLLRFEPRVHWRDARKSLQVWIDVDGERRVDTESIFVSKRPLDQPMPDYLERVQAYIAKDKEQCDIFGNWVTGETAAAAQLKEYMQEIIDTEDHDLALAMLKQYFPKQWIFSNVSCRSLLRDKVRLYAKPHVPTFDPEPWRLPDKIRQWERRNFSARRTGRPTLLVVEGLPRCGKTEWALSFGKPARMDGGWDMSQLLIPGITHLVLNDVKLDAFPYKRELISCQEYITCTGKYREEQTIRLGIPIIWTCNEDNNPMRDPKLRRYFEQCPEGVVSVKLRRKLYGKHSVD